MAENDTEHGQQRCFIRPLRGVYGVLTVRATTDAPNQLERLKMDYTKASDFEINKAVAIKQGLLVQELDDTRYIGMTSDFHEKYPSTIWGAKADERGMQCEPWEQINYCNDPSVMWPIITDNAIAISPFVEIDGLWNGEWVACIPYHVDGACIHYDDDEAIANKNPLRAAAIVYLMMEE